jgi:hypothetical protein
MQGRGLVSNQPEGANAGSGIALLPLAVSFLALELNLGLDGDGPGFPWPPAQDICPPVAAIGRGSGLLRESLPACGPGSKQALSLDGEMEVALLGPCRRLPGRMSEESCSEA